MPTPAPTPMPTPAPTPATPTPAPTPTPTQPPTTPTPAGPGLCCYGGCGGGNCQGGWCGESRGNCEGNCNGEFCPARALLRSIKEHQTAEVAPQNNIALNVEQCASANTIATVSGFSPASVTQG